MTGNIPRSAKRIGFFTRLLDDATASERYQLAVEQIAAAERFGYNSAWIAQHHFDPDEGGLPSPFVFLAYAAARTSTIRLGTGVLTLPLEETLRAVEDAVVLDHLSRGRLELGLGTGGTPATFEAFGRDITQKGPLYGSQLELLRAALTGGELPGGRRLYPSGGTLNERVWQATFSVEGGPKPRRGALSAHMAPTPRGSSASRTQTGRLTRCLLSTATGSTGDWPRLSNMRISW